MVILTFKKITINFKNYANITYLFIKLLKLWNFINYKIVNRKLGPYVIKLILDFIINKIKSKLNGKNNMHRRKFQTQTKYFYDN